jgi:hypothetical protein
MTYLGNESGRDQHASVAIWDASNESWLPQFSTDRETDPPGSIGARWEYVLSEAPSYLRPLVLSTFVSA